VGQASGCCRIREAVSCLCYILPFHHHCATSWVLFSAIVGGDEM
jgi:hypothetical protein